MSDSIVEFKANGDDIREEILEQVVSEHNTVVDLVNFHKEQGDVDERADEILQELSPVQPTKDENGKPVITELGNVKFLLENAKAAVAKLTKDLRDGALEEAKAGISSDYDVDKGRAAIKDARATWAESYASALKVFKMVKSVVTETTTDEAGKTTSELVAGDHFGTVLLKVSSAPSIRAKRGSGESSANTEGAKIRAWGKENGWADLSDRGPLPQELKDKYAETFGTASE